MQQHDRHHRNRAEGTAPSGRLRSTLASPLRTAGPLVAALALVAVGVGASRVQQESGDAIAETRAAYDRLFQVNAAIAEEQRNWRRGKQQVQDQITMAEREVEELRVQIEEYRSNLGDVDAEREELLAENEELKAGVEGLPEVVAALEARTAALFPRLPQPVQDLVRPMLQRFPEDPAESKLSLGVRFQNVATVLSLVNKAHRNIEVTSEVRTLADGTSARGAALYLGVSKGYFATTNGQHASVGTSTETGWEWVPADEAAADIARMIEIHGGGETAAYVPVPLEVR